MGCFIVLLALFLPRVTLFCLWLFGDYLQRAFPGQILLPLMGFFFLPYTTLAWAYANLHGGVSGGNEVLVIIGALFDICSLGGSTHQTRRRSMARG